MRKLALIVTFLALPVPFALAGDAVQTEDGDMEMKSVDIPVTELPGPVRDAIMRDFPGATLISAEREGDEFEVRIKTADGKKKEVELDVGGKMHPDSDAKTKKVKEKKVEEKVEG